MTLFSKPSYSTLPGKKREIPEGLWTKCPLSGAMVYRKDLEDNLMVVPQSGYHFPLAAPQRIASLVDEGSFEPWDSSMRSVDVLQFSAKESYTSKLESYQKRTGVMDAVICGRACLEGMPISLSVMDFRFLGGSMGSVVGEKITRAIERAIELSIPVVIVSSSGGARMYEGILSLMQMAKTSAALGRLAQKKLPYISVLTNPTTAGVMASYASLGDLILAEPGAMVGFAGLRVIKDTSQQELPEGFQTAEFVLKHGLIDGIVPRKELRGRVIFLLKGLGGGLRA